MYNAIYQNADFKCCMCNTFFQYNKMLEIEEKL